MTKQSSNLFPPIISLCGVPDDAVLRLTEMPNARTGIEFGIGPVDLLLFRHIESEGNLAHNKLRAGTLSEEDKAKIIARPDWQFRGTSKGVAQGEALRDWINRTQLHLDFIMSSGFYRTGETAGVALTGTPYEHHRIMIQDTVEERGYGEHYLLEPEEMKRQNERRFLDPSDWTPVGGSSMRVAKADARSLLNTLHDRPQYADKSIGIFTHGEKILAFRSIIERWLPEKLGQELRNGTPNAGIVHYTRRSPWTGEVHENFTAMRLVQPHNLSEKKHDGWTGDWKTIERATYTPKQLLDRARSIPRLFEAE